jgi:hypothetical protein
MRKLLSHFADLGILLAVVMLLFITGRLVLYFEFQHYFDHFTNSEIFKAFFSGFEYDLKVVLLVNSLFIFLFFLPVKIYNSAFYLVILKFIYFTFNCLALLFNILDINSFSFTGKRIDIVNYKDEFLRIVNELKELSILRLFTQYIILTIGLIIIVILLKSILQFIQKRDFEQKSIRMVYFIIPFVILSLYGWSVYGFLTDNGNWLSRLYTRADRQLAPLMMNNPYLFIASASNFENEKEEYWNHVEFQSQKKYNSINAREIKRIFFVFVESNELVTNDDKPEINTDDSIKELNFNVLHSYPASLNRYLDETLLSIPSVLPTEFSKSVHSLNSFESLAQILEKRSFNTSLFSIGYQRKEVKLLKNFYGFNQFKMLDSLVGNKEELTSAIMKEQVENNTLKTFHLLIMKEVNKTIWKSILTSYLNKSNGDELLCVFYIPSAQLAGKPRILPTMKMYLHETSGVKWPGENMLAQCMDIKPTVLHYLNFRTGFVAYGYSLFADENKSIFTLNDLHSYNLLKDSLLLTYEKNETKSLLILKNNLFSSFDFKDSLAIEKIDLENRIHSILMDFEYRTRNNKLK